MDETVEEEDINDLLYIFGSNENVVSISVCRIENTCDEVS